MSRRILYNESYKRVIPAVLIDSRAFVPAITTATGYEVKAYTDAQVSLVTSTVIPYKIETDNGNLAGYFNLQVSTSPVSASVLNKQLRPAFQQFESEINQEISNFIQSSNWKADYLF